MKDVSDYLGRMFAAIFLCPVAAAFWLGFASFGFNLGKFMMFVGSVGQQYVAMDFDSQITAIIQGLFGWSALAFVFLLISFVAKPPRFSYSLNKVRRGRSGVSVVG